MFDVSQFKNFMSDRHEHHDHDHGQAPAPEPQAQDAGTQALAEALRSSFTIVKVVMALMVVAFFCSGFFTVGPTEKAVKLRFGKPVGEGSKLLLGSGVHWSWPYPIDEVVHIPLTEQQNVQSSVGWYFTTAADDLAGEGLGVPPSLDPVRDGYVITADRNIIHTRATLSYHIDDPIRYVFSFASATNTIQNILNNALLYTAAHYKVDDALYTDVAGFQDAVLHRVSDMVEQEQLGIVIDNCQVLNIPPRQLKSDFAQVNISRENRDKTMNEARGQANDIVLNAGARAAAITNQAQSERVRYVTTITSEAGTFTNLLAKYQANPNLFVQQFFIPVVGDVLTNTGKWFLPQRADGKPRELRLQLNREPVAQKPGQ
jgi:modulator of FtsH protease HflK